MLKSEQKVRMITVSSVYTIMIMIIVGANRGQDLGHLQAFLYLMPFVLISGIGTFFSFVVMCFRFAYRKNTAVFWGIMTMMFLYMTLVPYVWLRISIGF